MAELLRVEEDRYYTYYYYKCRQCGKEVRYAQRCIKSEPICMSCQKLNNKKRAMKKQDEKENAAVNAVLDDLSADINHLHDWVFSREEVLRIINDYRR